ncbi:NADH-quinone oxidoreductase subunit H, partial [Klebsiella pneumoniae]|uniref:NADH-quinone oxidoreductase subunit H n=1 Tax=Klebsiella pneumoniae TaxID=573 RepID=UPI003F261599
MAVLITLVEVVTVLFALVWLAGLLSWIERRLLGFWQDRLGPNRVGWQGTLQILADIIKIL